MTRRAPSNPRVTRADLNHLNTVGTVWSTNFGLEILFTDEPDEASLQAALDQACRLSPRMRARFERQRWVPGPLPAVRATTKDLAALRSEFVDATFDPAAGPPLRSTLRGRRLFLACMHGVCDTPGLIGVVGDMASFLSGTHRTAGPTPRVHPLLERQAWQPSVLRSLRQLRKIPARHCTPFPSRGPAAVESEAAVASLSEQETRAVIGHAGSTGPAGLAGEVLLARCLEKASAGETATLFVPVNLRRSGSRWRPAGNHLGHLLIHHDEPAPAAVLAAEIREAHGAARYAAPLERLVGDLRHVFRRRQPLPADPALDAPVISLNLNNMGRIDANLLPGIEEMTFLGSNSPLYPVVSLLTVGERMTICARVRRHHGGFAVARELVDLVRHRLLP